ncbi:unnamed protein product, partial [Ixodes persulcatus]
GVRAACQPPAARASAARRCRASCGAVHSHAARRCDVCRRLPRTPPIPVPWVQPVVGPVELVRAAACERRRWPAADAVATTAAASSSARMTPDNPGSSPAFSEGEEGAGGRGVGSGRRAFKFRNLRTLARTHLARAVNRTRELRERGPKQLTTIRPSSARSGPEEALQGPLDPKSGPSCRTEAPNIWMPDGLAVVY